VKRFGIITIFIIIMLFTSCAKKESKLSEISEERIISDIKENDKLNYKNPGEYEVYITDDGEEFIEDEKISVVTKVVNMNYSFEDGIFNRESGYLIPMEFVYVKNGDDYELKEIIQAKDGEEYFDSVLEMARGDKDLANRISNVVINTSVNDKLMNELKEVCEKEGLKNFTHKLKKIPGYESDVIYIRDENGLRDGVVEVAKKDDYEGAKAQVGKENWPNCDGVEYHEETGIAVKTIIDNFK